MMLKNSRKRLLSAYHQDTPPMSSWQCIVNANDSVYDVNLAKLTIGRDPDCLKVIH